MDGAHLTPRVRFRDLSVPPGPRRDALRDAFESVMDSGQWIMGPGVERFEARLASACGRARGVGVASGTSALYLALRACDVGPGDEVVVPALSWIATANAVAATGARPVFVDVGADLLIDPAAAAAAIGPRTKAILPVHFTGRLADMDAICALAARHDALVIEDAAQAFGARRAGVMAGGFGHLGAFSLNPMKLLPGYGEAGLIVLDDPARAARLAQLRYLGTVDRERCVEIALNHKIDALQAALIEASLPFFEAALQRRRQIAADYVSELGSILRCPAPARGRDCVFFDFSARTEARSALLAHLAADGIEAKIKHPIALPDQPVFAHLPPTDAPEARAAADEIVSLPIHDRMTDDDVAAVVGSVRRFFGRCG